MKSTKIWHYTSFPALVSIIQNQTLPLTRIVALRDPFEGIRKESGILRSMFNNPARRGFVHCWTQAREESELFWLAYANAFGVAIESTISRLQSALSCDGEIKPEFAAITYWDGKRECAAEGWARKRPWFRWEKEFRVHVPWYAGAPDDAVEIRVDPKKLISAVWVSPHAPLWLDRVLEREMQIYDLGTVPVQRRRNPSCGPTEIKIWLDNSILNQLHATARERHLPLNEYVSDLLECGINPP